MPQIINNLKYYPLSEVSTLAGVNARTLRRWIGDGCLDHFLFRFKETKTSCVLYRLEPPTADDVLWDGEDKLYRLPTVGENEERKNLNE